MAQSFARIGVSNEQSIFTNRFRSRRDMSHTIKPNRKQLMSDHANTFSQNSPAESLEVADNLKAANCQVAELKLGDESHALRHSNVRNGTVDINSEMASRSDALEVAYASTSSRANASLRGTRRLIGWFLKRLLKLPRIFAHRCLLMGLRLVIQNSKWASRVRRLIRYFPWLEAKLRIFVQARRRRDDVSLPSEIQWVVQPDPAVLQAWQTLLGVKPSQPPH